MHRSYKHTDSWDWAGRGGCNWSCSELPGHHSVWSAYTEALPDSAHLPNPPPHPILKRSKSINKRAQNGIQSPLTTPYEIYKALSDLPVCYNYDCELLVALDMITNHLSCLVYLRWRRVEIGWAVKFRCRFDRLENRRGPECGVSWRQTADWVQTTHPQISIYSMSRRTHLAVIS